MEAHESHPERVPKPPGWASAHRPPSPACDRSRERTRARSSRTRDALVNTAHLNLNGMLFILVHRCARPGLPLLHLKHGSTSFLRLPTTPRYTARPPRRLSAVLLPSGRLTNPETFPSFSRTPQLLQSSYWPVPHISQPWQHLRDPALPSSWIVGTITRSGGLVPGSIRCSLVGCSL